MHAIFARGRDGQPLPRSSARVHIAADQRAPSRGGRRAIWFVALICLAGAAAGLVVVAPLKEQAATEAGRARPMVRPFQGPMALMATAQPIPRQRSPSVPAEGTFSSRAPTASHIVQARSSNRLPDHGESFGPAAPCDADGQRYDACRRDVLDADRDLRSAYLRAVETGVEREQLVSIRNRWARLRALEFDRPDDLLADYAALTERLDREAQFSGEDPR